MKKIIKLLLILVIIVGIAFALDVPTRVMKLLYPIKYENFVEENSKKYNIDKYLIYAVIKAESNFNETAESREGAKGLMQLMYNTAKDILKKTDEIPIKEDELKSKILEPQYNIALGTKYISLLLEQYGNLELALAAYNAGIGNVNNWVEQGIIQKDGSDIENVPFKETNNYVRKILRDYKIYKELYEKNK